MTANFITALAVKSFDEPDKKRCPDKAEVDLVSVNDFSVARLILAPGWRWSECTKPTEQTPFCQHNHLGFCLSGVMEVEAPEGTRSFIRANDTYAIPPGTTNGWWVQSRSLPLNFLARHRSGGRSAADSTPESEPPRVGLAKRLLLARRSGRDNVTAIGCRSS